MATDPYVRMAGNKAVCNFRLVTNRIGNDGDVADYHNIVVWDKLAENVGTYLQRGFKLYVEGRMQTREWVANDGQKKTTAEIVADKIEYFDTPSYKPQSITRTTTIPEKSVTMTTADFVNQSMDKQDNVQEIKLSDIPF